MIGMFRGRIICQIIFITIRIDNAYIWRRKSEHNISLLYPSMPLIYFKFSFLRDEKHFDVWFMYNRCLKGQFNNSCFLIITAVRPSPTRTASLISLVRPSQSSTGSKNPKPSQPSENSTSPTMVSPRFKIWSSSKTLSSSTSLIIGSLMPRKYSNCRDWADSIPCTWRAIHFCGRRWTAK